MNNNYYGACLKRQIRMFPPVLVALIAVSLVLVLLGSMVLATLANSDAKTKIQVGLVGNSEGTYLGIGIDAMSKYDSLRFEISFLPYASPEEAKAALLGDSIDCYIIIPDNFVDDLVYGGSPQLEYVSTENDMFLGAAIMRNVAKIASDCVSQCEAGIFSVQYIVIDNRIAGGNTAQGDYVMSERYIDFILNRSKTFEPVLLGISDGVTTEEYYFCALVFFFLLMWGVFCSKMLLRRKTYYIGYLKSRGIGVCKQVLCEYFAYFTISACTLLLFCTAGAGALYVLSPNLAGFDCITLADGLLFAVKLMPALLAVTAFQFFLFEAIDSECGAVLAQFIGGMMLAYLGGCFYPIDYFPTFYQRLVNYLPNGVCFAYIRQSLLSQINPGCLLGVLGYFCLFTALSVAVTKKRVGRAGA